MNSIYLLVANNGAYDERASWIVAAFTFEDDANAARDAVVAWYQGHPRLSWENDAEQEDNAPDGPWGWWKQDAYRHATCPYDPEAMDHNGEVDEPNYSVQRVDVWDLGEFFMRRRPALKAYKQQKKEECQPNGDPAQSLTTRSKRSRNASRSPAAVSGAGTGAASSSSRRSSAAPAASTPTTPHASAATAPPQPSAPPASNASEAHAAAHAKEHDDDL